eukprot:3118895-Pyramimonas_sp.AAC.2
MVLNFFGAPLSDYHVVFTRGATSALQMVGETFPWDKDRSEFVYLVRIRPLTSPLSPFKGHAEGASP